MATDTIGTHIFKDHHKGDDWKGGQFTISVNGSPLDLDQATVRVQFRKDKKTGWLAATLTVGSGITIVDAANGILSIDQIDELDWPAGIYYYDIEITSLSGYKKTYVEGTLTVCQDTTKTT